MSEESVESWIALNVGSKKRRPKAPTRTIRWHKEEFALVAGKAEALHVTFSAFVRYAATHFKPTTEDLVVIKKEES